MRVYIKKVDNLFERIFRNEILMVHNPGIARQIGIISEQNGFRKDLIFAWDRRKKATLIFCPTVRLKHKKKYGNGSIFEVEFNSAQLISKQMINVVSNDFEMIKKRLPEAV
jgi:hypothetical protein